MRTIYTFVLVLMFFCVNNLFAQNFIVHKVKQGETLYGIAKKYDVPINTLFKNNPSLTQDNLKIGTELRIPSKTNIVVSNKNTTTTTNKMDYDTILHQVKPKETMYGIAKIYQVNFYDIKTWNNLSNTDLNINDVIKILKPKKNDGNKSIVNNTASLNKSETKKIEELEIKKPTTNITIEKPKEQNKSENSTTKQPESSTVVSASGESEAKILTLSEQFANQKKDYDVVVKKATGAPMSTNDPSINNTFFALHKSAKVGSIIKIKNLENNKITHAKVIGTLPEIDENKNILLRLSLGARKAINMGNGKAYLEMEFVE